MTAGSRLINARSETASEKPSFRAAFKRRHCLVLIGAATQKLGLDNDMALAHQHLGLDLI